MAPRRKQKDEKKELQNALQESKKPPPDGDWKDILAATSPEQLMDGHIDWNKKRFHYKYTMVTWESMNKITEDLSTEVNVSNNPVKYERAKQAILIKEIVREFAGQVMYDDKVTHGPIEDNWKNIPAPIGEELRIEFFRNTGEVLNKLGINEESFAVLRKLMNSIADENGYVLKDGKITKQEKALKK